MAMDEELRAYLDAMVARINDQFEHLLNRLDDLTMLGGANDRVGLSAGHVRDERGR